MHGRIEVTLSKIICRLYPGHFSLPPRAHPQKYIVFTRYEGGGLVILSRDKCVVWQRGYNYSKAQ